MPKITGRLKIVCPLSTIELRVLRVLGGGSALTRKRIGELAGFTEASGSVTRAMNGIYEGSSSGPSRPGLLKLGLVERHDLDLDGYKETAFVITEAGQAVLAERGGDLPPLRDAKLATNRRYQKEKGPTDADGYGSISAT